MGPQFRSQGLLPEIIIIIITIIIIIIMVIVINIITIFIIVVVMITSEDAAVEGWVSNFVLRVCCLRSSLSSP